MPRYTYVALDVRGQESTGSMESASPSEVLVRLRQAGCFPTSVREEKDSFVEKSTPRVSKNSKSKNITLFQRKTVKPKTLVIFTRQLATLIDAGLPLLRSLNVLAKQERDPVLKVTINQVAASIQNGGTFSDGLSQHPRLFNKLYVNMVKAGEIGGVLELVLTRLAEFQEKAQKVKNKVVAAMVYPVIVLLLALVIMIVLLVFIVPKFETIFHDMLGDKPLPAITLFVMSVSDFMQTHWAPLLGLIFVLVATNKLLGQTKRGRYALDQTQLHAPVFGDLIRKSSVARFSRTLGTLVTSGVPILQALNITSETAGNTVIAQAIMKVHDSVKEGDSIAQPLETSRAFPQMVVSMIDVGEETGQLPEMLLKIADVYDDEVDNAVAALTSLLEPIMIVLLALIVGTIVIALFMPLVSIISGLQQQG